MITRFWSAWLKRRKLILLTFEIFWIVVFTLERISSAGAGEVPPFIYVAF